MAYDPYVREAIWLAITKERVNQEQLRLQGKFDFTAADPELSAVAAAAILAEECGEVAREALAVSNLVKESGDVSRLRKELVQTAAVCVAWLEKLGGGP